MPYTVPAAADLQARYPAFANVSTTWIDTVIAEASRSVGTDWAEADYQPAIMALAAHMLTKEGALGAIKSGGSVASRSFDGMSVTYKQSSSQNTSELDDTEYGKNYLRMLRRNVGGAYVLDGSY